MESNDDEYHQRQILSDGMYLRLSYTYISNNAVGIQLMEKGDSYLKVNQSFPYR